MYGPFYYFALLLNTVKKEKLGIILTHDFNVLSKYFIFQSKTVFL